MATRVLGLVVLVILSAITVPTDVRAGSESPATPPTLRQLGPHLFAGAVSYPNPFLSTYVRTSTGLATTTKHEIIIYDLGDRPRVIKEQDITLQYLLQEFEFQQRVTRHVALQGTVSGSARMGVFDTEALLSDGVKVDLIGSLGGTVSLLTRSRFTLAGSLNFTGAYLGDVLIRNLLEDVVENGLTDTTSSVWDDVTTLGGTAGFRAAFGHNQHVGYILYGDIGARSAYLDDEDTESVWDVGAVLSLDMHDSWGPDLGVTLNAMYRSPGHQDQYTEVGQWYGDLGLFYTARPELTLGLETGYTPLRKVLVDEWYGMVSVLLLLRYDFS